MYTIFFNVKTDREFSATTGLSKVEFHELAYVFEEVEGSLKSERLATGGRKEALSDGAVRLFFILYYLKTYPSFDVLGLSFGIDASTAERYVQQLLPVLQKTWQQLQRLPARKAEEITLLASFLGKVDTILVDATERPVARPKEELEQQGKYSGKKNDIQ